MRIPSHPAFGHSLPTKLERQKMFLPRAATISKFGLPTVILLAFNCNELSEMVRSDMSLRSAGAHSIARRRSKHVR